MEGMTTCHKCKRRITGRIIYEGGWVWHPRCYPLKKSTKISKKGHK